MKCTICLASGKQTGDSFVTEEGCKNFMKKSVQQHEDVHHKEEPKPASAGTQAKFALEAASIEQGAHQRATEHAQRLAWAEVAYHNSKHPTASDLMFPGALDAFDRGAKRLGLKHATTNEKRSGAGAAAATDAFSDILKQEQIDDMNASPIIGIGCDESTDVAVIEQLILFVYFTKDGTVKSQYFEIVDLHGATAEAIKKALVDALDRRVPGLKKKLLMLGSDGCSVVLGKDKGLEALLRRSEKEFDEGSPIAYLLQLHCMGHKLQPSVGEGLKTPETHQVDRLLTETYGIFSHSGQRRERLGKVYDELNNAIDELHADAKMKSTKRHIKVRWLSREQSIDSLLGPLDALIAYLHILKKPKSRNRSAGEAADDGEHDDDPDLSETAAWHLVNWPWPLATSSRSPCSISVETSASSSRR